MRGNRPFFTTRVYTSATIETTEIYIRKSFFFFLFFPESVDIPTDLVSTWLSIFLNLLTVEKIDCKELNKLYYQKIHQEANTVL